MSRTQLVVICLALLPACGPSHALLKQGREAAAAQDYESAYLSYNAVLQQKPTHGEALAGRRIAQEQVLAAADDEVTRLLAAGRLDAVAGVIEASSAVDPPADWVSARLERWSGAWITRLRGGLSDAQDRGAHGEAWVYADALAEFTDGGEPERDRAWATLVQTEWPGVAVSAAGPSAAEIRTTLGREWAGGRWSIVPFATRAPRAGEIGLGFQVRERRCSVERVGNRTAVQRYKDGTMVPNPEVPRLQGELRSAAVERAAVERDVEERRRAEDRAFRRLEETSRASSSFGPLVDAAADAAAQTHQRVDVAAAAVEEASGATERLRLMQGEEADLRVERGELAQRHDQAEREQATARRGLQDLERRLGDLQAQLKGLRTDRDQLAQQVAALQERAAQLDAKRKQLRERLAELEVEPAPAGAELRPIPEIKEELEGLEGELELARAAVDAALEAKRAAPPETTLKTARDTPAGVLAERTAELRALEGREAVLQAELIQARLRRNRQNQRKLASELATEEQALARAQGKVDGVRPLVRQARQEREQRAAAVAELERELQSIDGRLVEIDRRQARIQEARSELGPVASDLARRESDLRRKTTAWRAATVTLDQARGEAAHLAGVRVAAEEAHLAVRAGRVEAEGVLRDWDQHMQALDAELRRQPDRVELLKEANYTVTQHRRTCVIRADYRVASPLAQPTEDSLSFIRVDLDDTHRANPRIRLSADALAFPTADTDVLAALTTQTTVALGEALRAQLTREGQARRQVPTRSLDGATRHAAIAELMDPDGSLGAFLHQRYDLPSSAPPSGAVHR